MKFKYLWLLCLIPLIAADLDVSFLPVIDSNTSISVFNPYYTQNNIDLGILYLIIFPPIPTQGFVPITGFFQIGVYDYLDTPKMLFFGLMLFTWVMLIVMSNVLHIPHVGALQLIIGLFLGVLASAVSIILLIGIWLVSGSLAFVSYA